jgi:chromosome segregation ATPase
LQGEVEHLQTAKQEKEDRLRAQVQRSEQLLGELERISHELTLVKGEKEATMEARGLKERDLDHLSHQLKSLRGRLDSHLHSLRALERATAQLCERQILQPPVITTTTHRKSSKAE